MAGECILLSPNRYPMRKLYNKLRYFINGSPDSPIHTEPEIVLNEAQFESYSRFLQYGEDGTTGADIKGLSLGEYPAT